MKESRCGVIAKKIGMTQIFKENGEVVISYILFFFLFRYFDIAKPFPVNFFDKNFKNSFGVIMDDICAGLYVVLTVICFMVIKNYVL